MAEKPTVETEMNDALARDDTHARVPGHARAYSSADSTSYSSYLFGAAGQAGKPLWSDSTQGRAAIRLFSRGIVGALAMTAVDRVSRTHLLDYTPESINTMDRWMSANVSQKIAKVYDVAAGVPIRKIVEAATPGGAHRAAIAGREAVTFRQKAYFHNGPGHMPGHSLGAEIVQVTASFAAGSLGDAGTRNIIQTFDPNNMKPWLKNDQGEIAKPGEKKHFDFDTWFKSTTRTAWRVVTKNMGEDWAVALPYVYQMRWQRNMLAANRFPDAKLMFDNGLAGGSSMVNRQGQIIGDFQAAGAIDLHTRFVGYNWYTLMYREAYDAIGRGFGDWKKNGFEVKLDLPKNPIAASIDAVGHTARYVAKSFIKANLYMNPAVVPFWAIRVPQGKWRAPAIVAQQGNSLNGFLMEEPNLNKLVERDARGALRHKYDSLGTRLRQTSNSTHGYIDGVGKVAIDPLLRGEGVYSFDMAKKLVNAHPISGAFSAALMPFGWASYKMGSGMTHLANKMPAHWGITRAISTSNGVHSAWNRENFARSFVDNSFSYTPYMIAKAETALRVDERPADGGLGEMDKAIYKFIDSGVRFDLKSAGHACREIWYNALDLGREVKMREGGELAVPIASKPAAVETPANRIDAASIQRDPASRERASDQQADAAQHDKHWAESVTGRSLTGQFQPGAHSIH